MQNKKKFSDKAIEADQYVRDDLERQYWLQDLKETYFMCRQLNNGDVGLEVQLSTSFETIYDHVYVSHGGCPWCQKRIALKRKYRLSKEKPESNEQDRELATRVLSLS